MQRPLFGHAALAVWLVGGFAFAGGHASSRGEFKSSGGGPASGASYTSGASARGAAEYQRNSMTSKILNPQALEGLSKSGSESAKAIADSQGKFMQQVNQITSQPIDAGKEVINQLASAVPDASTLTSSSTPFEQLAKSQQELFATDTQLLQVQSQGALQLPAPQPTDATPTKTVGERLQQIPNRRPVGPRNPILYQSVVNRPTGGSSLSRLPQAYNAPTR